MKSKPNPASDILDCQERPEIIIAKPRSGMSIIGTIDVAKEFGMLGKIAISNQPGNGGNCNKGTE